MLSSSPTPSGEIRLWPLCLLSLLLSLAILTLCPEPETSAKLTFTTSTAPTLPITSTCHQLFETIEIKVMEADRIENELATEFHEVFTHAVKAAPGMTDEYAGKEAPSRKASQYEIQQRGEKIRRFDEKAAMQHVLAMQIKADMAIYANLCCTTHPNMSWKVWKARQYHGSERSQ